MRKALLTLLILLTVVGLSAQTTVDITSDRDNTMYEESPDFSNGAGDHMFTGITDNGDIRRALLRFDVAGNVPAGANITNVTLTLNMSKTIVGPTDVSLHVLNKDWGEAGSDAPGQEGQGTMAQTNDATWTYNFFNSSQWTSGGANGDYNTTPSATTSVNGTGQYSWSSSQLTSDVQDMLDNGGTNYGWIIIGDESTSPTAKRFDTRENPTQSNRPELSITYTMPPSAQKLIINEVDYDQPGTDDAEFIELKNEDNSDINLSNYEVELVNGSNGSIYQTIALPNVSLAPGDYYVICANNSNTPNCDLQVSPSTNLIQNGSPDAVGIKFNGDTVIDAVSYEGNTVAPYTETSGVGLEDDGGMDSMSISRIPDGTDTDVNNQDFSFVCATPGVANGGPQITITASGGASGICPGDSLLLMASGDNENPQWYFNGNPISGATDTFYYAQMEGTYNVMADKSFCRDSAETGFSLTVFDPPQVDLGPDTSVCQSYLLDAGNPGSDYDWNTGQDTRIIQANSSNIYSVTVTDNDGCVGVDSVDVAIGSPVSVNLADTTEGCDSALIDAGEISNATYLWNTGDTTSSILVSSEGKYWVTVERNGCTASDTTNVLLNPTPMVDLGPDVQNCDSVTLEPAVSNVNDPSYKWSTGESTSSLTITNTGLSNQYTVTVTSNEGCSASDSIGVTILPNPSVDLGNDFQACNQATIDVGNVGETYQWNTGDTTQSIEVTTSGDYMVTVTDSNGCTASDTVNVSINPALVVDLGNDTTVCDSIGLSVNIPNATYAWSTGDTTQSIAATSTGMYAVTVTQNGCSGNDTVSVTINESPSIDLGPDITACDEATLDAGNQTGDILWSNGLTSQTITVNSSGTYSVEVTENGCVAKDTVEVSINSTPPLELGPDIEACESATIDAGVPDANYDWSTGDTTSVIEVSSSGQYAVTVTDSGCSAADTINVTIHDAPEFTLGPDVETCEDTSIAAPMEGDYAWSTGSDDSILTVSQGGTYVLTITNAQGCSSDDTINIAINDKPMVDLGPDQVVCDSTKLTASGGVDYEWNTGATSETITATQSGTYAVTVTDENGCSGSDTIDVEVNTAPVAAFAYDESECPVVSFADSSSGTIDSWEWDFGDTSSVETVQHPSHEYSSNGDYDVTLLVSNQCGSDETTQSITIDCISGVEEFNRYFRLYPNPADEHLIVQSNDPLAKEARIELVNVNGQTVRTATMNSDTEVISLSDLAGGNYFLLIHKEGRTFSAKVVVTK